MASKARGHGVYKPKHGAIQGSRAPAAVPAKAATDKGYGQPPTSKAPCPQCGAQVPTRYRPGAWEHDKRRYIGSHRPGGGPVRVLRGDAPCLGAGAEVESTEEAS